jgi:hypothetical protein
MRYGSRLYAQETLDIILCYIPVNISLDLALYNVSLESCTESWFSFLKGEMIGPAGKFPLCSFVDGRVCSCRRYDDYLDMIISRLHFQIGLR